MNFISAQDFSSQSEKVQETFMKWWKPQIGERMYSNGISFGEYIYLKDYKQSGYRVIGVHRHEISVTDKKVFVPLLQMHQLVNFIEDKTKGRVDIEHGENKIYIVINRIIENECFKIIIHKYEFKDLDLLQVLWQVACEIAEGERNE